MYQASSRVPAGTVASQDTRDMSAQTEQPPRPKLLRSGQHRLKQHRSSLRSSFSSSKQRMCKTTS